MSDGHVTRPEASKRKIHSKDEFELCYLRHQYLRKTSYNPTEAEMAPYMHVIKNLAKNTFYTYQNLLCMVGLDLDDIINIGRVHLTSYLGLFSINIDPNRLQNFEQTFFNEKGYPAGIQDVLGKDKADLTAFIKQRYEDLIRICRQKGRNIKGHCVEEFFCYKGPSRPPKVLRKLAENHEQYGYKKIDAGSFRTIKKKARPTSNIFEYEGLWYVAVLVDHKTLGIEDFTGAGLSPYDNIHNMTPEQILQNKRGESDLEQRKREFEGYSLKMKVNKIKNFIRKNYRKKALAAEIATARKMLKSLEE